VVKTFGRGGAAPCHPWFFGFWNLAIEMTADYTDGTDIRNTILPYPCDPCHPWFFGFWNLGIEVCLGFGNWDLGFRAMDTACGSKSQRAETTDCTDFTDSADEKHLFCQLSVPSALSVVHNALKF
jgi:hypothetical protein